MFGRAHKSSCEAGDSDSSSPGCYGDRISELFLDLPRSPLVREPPSKNPQTLAHFTSRVRVRACIMGTVQGDYFSPNRTEGLFYAYLMCAVRIPGSQSDMGAPGGMAIRVAGTMPAGDLVCGHAAHKRQRRKSANTLSALEWHAIMNNKEIKSIIEMKNWPSTCVVLF